MIEVLLETLLEAVRSRMIDLLPLGIVATSVAAAMIFWLLVRYRELREGTARLERHERELLRAEASAERSDEEVGEIAQRFRQLAIQCENDPGRAEQLAIMLGDVCRSMARLSRSSLSSIREETELIRDRILLESTRDGHPLEVRIDLAPELEDMRIDRSFLVGATTEIIEKVFGSSARTLVLRVRGERTFVSFSALIHSEARIRRVFHRSAPTTIDDRDDSIAPAWQYRARLTAFIVLGIAVVKLIAGEIGLWLATIRRPVPWDTTSIPVSSDLWLVATTAAAAALLIILELRSGSLDARALAVGDKLRQAERRRLETQLQPHFLLNAINTIANLITTDPVKAAETCRRLESFLQHVRRSRRNGLIPLAEELANLESYLEVEQVRFGGRLRISCEVSADARMSRLPSLLLQPLFENAIRHGIARLSKGGEIRLAAAMKNEDLEIIVENEARSSGTTETGGIGLRNTIERLQLSCGESAWLRTSSRSGRFRVELSVPQTKPDDRLARPSELSIAPTISDLPVLLCHTRARAFSRG